jgi:hypothetical protein
VNNNRTDVVPYEKVEGDASVVVVEYERITGLKDLGQKTAIEWAARYGPEYILAKLGMLEAEIDGIDAPLKWLAAALARDWTAAEDPARAREAARKKADEEKMARIRAESDAARVRREDPQYRQAVQGRLSDLVRRARGGKTAEPAE